jgi:hypothetical protein
MNTSFQDIQMNWNYPTPIQFGAGRLKTLPQVCSSHSISAPLLVTDSTLATLPLIKDTVLLCKEAGLKCGLFSDIQPNPIEKNVMDGVAIYKQGGHDGVIAMGGGSALDAAKAIALMVGQNRPLWDFEDREDWYTRVNVDGMAPVIAIPTTSGTGSEVGRCSVITDLRDHTKKIIFHPKMLPGLVIADPEVTFGLPAHITAGVGMDALSHNLEAYCSPLYHPMADGIALEGIKLIHQFLPQAYQDGHNLEARSQMLIASTMGATAFQKGLGAMHSMSHPCSAVLNTPHGLTNAVVMPYVLVFNQKEIASRIEDLARYMNLPNPSFNSFLDWVLQLRQDLKIPHTLAELGVSEDLIVDLSQRALVDPTAPTNPRPLDQASLEHLFTQAITGKI